MIDNVIYKKNLACLIEWCLRRIGNISAEINIQIVERVDRM